MFVVYAMLAYLFVALTAAAIVLRRVDLRHRREPVGSLYNSHGGTPVEVPLLHRANLDGRRLRFYRSPLIDPDFPWVVLRDLFEIATDGASYNVTAEWTLVNNPGLAQAILTRKGPELLLSHWAALELIASLVAEPGPRGTLIAAFREVTAEAYVLQCAGVTREAFLALCTAAGRRSHAFC
ncbi:hypothetical protein [Lichenicoccus sp.]|uniref:hypothetical protein n=1 Tax=Lichenicoccus sp. TaxID=2781899 RepID=UPI003D0BCC7F